MQTPISWLLLCCCWWWWCCITTQMIISSGDFIAQTIENENVRKNENSRSRNNKINEIDDDNREDNNNSSNNNNNDDDDNDIGTTEPSLILTPSEPQTEYLHSNLVLTCHVHAGDPVMARKSKRGMPHLYWHDSKGDVIEQHSARLRIERPDVYTVKLYISNISTEQAGLYKCALTWADLTEEKYLRVYVLDDITFTGADDPTKEVNAGENVQLNCKVQTNLLPTITWKFNGTIINKH
ncbi:hypothetical protein HELRODRAFT_188643, partial [Helobdella robusta]|uniref:Ig-like domain-containing protein n=1 Tax=Helobdella robusta TaxID=6412 RepID=T1FQ76_HELRO